MRTSLPFQALRPLLTPLFCTLCLSAGRLEAQCGPFDNQKFGASNPLPNALYGQALDLSGLRAVVGAYNEGPNGTGAVYFLAHNGTNWVEEQRIQQGGAFDNFGRSAAIDGDTAAVGTSSGVDRVVVFRRGPIQWTQEQALVAFGTGNPGWFSRVVDIDGDVLLAGSNNAASALALNTGRAWIWRRSGSAWTAESELVAPDAAQGDSFACSAAVSGDWAACGAVADDNNKGSAYLFHYDGTSWQFHAKLQPGDLSATARFGHSLDLDGDALIVGAYTDAGAGSAYVFRLVGGAWAQEVKLLPSGPGQHGFGEAVALSGDEALIRDHFGGFVERWSRMAGNWIPIGKLLATNVSSNGAYLGEDLAVSGTLALLGDCEDDQFGNRAGAVYAYDLAAYNGVCTYCTAQTTSQGCTSQITTSGTPSASAGSGFVLNAPNLVPGQVGCFMYSTQIGYSITPLGNGGTLCINGPMRYMPISSTGGSGPCSGSLSVDLNAWIAAGNDPSLVMGAVGRGQFWSRDVGSRTRNISDAVSFVVLP